MFLMSPYQRHYLPSSLLPVFYCANLSSVIHLALPLCNVYPTHIGLSSYCSLFWFVSFFFRFFFGGGGALAIKSFPLSISLKNSNIWVKRCNFSIIFVFLHCKGMLQKLKETSQHTSSNLRVNQIKQNFKKGLETNYPNFVLHKREILF